MHRRDAVQFRIDLRHERAQMQLFRESPRVEIPHRRCLYFRWIDLRIVDRLPSGLRDQIADRFTFLLQVALKIGSAAANDVYGFHRLVCPVGWIPEREYERGWETWQKLQ